MSLLNITSLLPGKRDSIHLMQLAYDDRPLRFRSSGHARKVCASEKNGPPEWGGAKEGLEQEFNSLHAQREACEAFIKSQAGEGWRLIRTHYDDGGLSGATMERPALQRLLADIDNRLVDAVVVYKVDRLTRSLADFAKMVEVFDARGVSFVAVTQQFNTTTSMGRRLTLNVLLSFAQFEREVTGGAHPRQDRRLQAQGHLDGWSGAARL
jgi:DNA invertase Pin-like site-specific DNA recombinase